MKKAVYYLCWAILLSFLLVMAVGTIANAGWGPVILGLVLIGAVIGILELG
jgi:general stress protein CsbA